MKLPKVAPARLVAGVLVFAFLFFWASVMFRTDFGVFARHGKTYEVTAIFDQVSGLTKDGEVKAGGVTVGRVRDISLKGKDRLPYVRMAIENGFRLKRGATADLLVSGNAGQLNRYIQLTQGSGSDLSDGSTLGVAFTDQPVEFDDVLGVLDGKTRADVKSVFAGLDGALKGRATDLRRGRKSAAPAFAQTTALLRALDQDGEALRSGIHDSRTIVGAIAVRPQTLGEWTERVQAFVSATARRQAAITATAQQAVAGLREPRLALERLDGALPQLKSLLPPAKAAVTELPATMAALRPALRSARPTLAEAARLTRTGPGSLRALTPTLKLLASQLGPATKLMCQAGPVLDTLRAQTPEVTGAIQLFGAITAGYDANGHGARVFLNVARILGGEATPDSRKQGLLEKPFLRIPGANADQPWTAWRDSFIGGDGKGC